MNPATRRTLARLEMIRTAERSRRLSRWAETVAMIQSTPTRSPDEARAKLAALESLRVEAPGT